MITRALNVILVALTWLAPALEALVEARPFPVAQEARPRATSPKDEPKGLVLAGRVVDGLGRPLSGVKVTLSSNRPGADRQSGAVLLTGDDGRYSGTIARTDGDSSISFEKDGYSNLTILTVATNPGRRVITLNRKIRWEEMSILPYQHGDKLDRGVLELLASEEWETGEDALLLGFLFRHQDHFRAALRRAIQDAHVGNSAREWLDVLGDPRDRDLFPKGRRSAPKHEIKEADLVDAIKATARHLHFNSSKAKPDIDIDFIAFTKEMNLVMIQCGINRVAITGITWRFVFQKVDKHWILRSMREAGRS
jgi:hypothetical protein